MNKLTQLLAEAVNSGANSRGRDALSQAILAYGSSTDDNLACTANIAVVQEEEYIGLGTASGRLLSGITNSAEGCAIPAELQESYPDLTQAEWDALLRVCTLLLTDLERTGS
ncbi:hypothetical protein [Halioxenophilus sp. WMMB6]|uniref:hypothetical protein n=1 Tax=Halioxenophilus sp. WMMB6 TaxID=3073815 RepID=UPI00295E755C|nr:hypothetical protein [Halioxenophilus sp. WMMB6]